MPAQPLTADLCARAIVAAARSYGDDPVAAFTTHTRLIRRSIAPAGFAVASATNRPLSTVARVFGLAPNSASNWACARREGGCPFEEALCAALHALGETEYRRPDHPFKGGGRTTEAAAPVKAAPRSSAIPAGKPPARRPEPVRAAPPPPKAADANRFGGGARAGGGARFGGLSRDNAPEPPPRTRSQISADERALIDAAIAAGKVTQAPTAAAEGGYAAGVEIKGHPSELTYDFAIRKYVRRG